MAFNLTGNETDGYVITQTGTDVGSDALISVADGNALTVIQGDLKNIFIFNNCKVVNEGDWEINGFTEALIWNNTDTIELSNEVGARLFINGRRVGLNGEFDYFNGSVLTFTRISGSSSGLQCFNTKGTFEWRGGTITAQPTFWLDEGSTVIFEESIFDGRSAFMFRIRTTNITFNGSLVIKGHRTTFDVNSQITLTGYAPTNSSGVDTFGQCNPILKDFAPFNNSKDYLLRNGNEILVDGCTTGMRQLASTVAGGPNNQNDGICRYIRRVKFSVVNSNDTIVENAKVFIPSYDDGNRLNLTETRGYDFTTLTDIIIQTDSTGTTNEFELLLKYWEIERGQPRSGLRFSRFDRDANDSGLIDVTYYHYGAEISTDTIETDGIGLLEINKKTISDFNISSTKAEASNLPIGVSFNGTAFSVSGTFDETPTITTLQLYDAICLYMETNFTGVDIRPSRIGTLLDFESLNVALNLDMVLIDGTIKLNATKTVNLSNGAKILGGTIDNEGDSFLTFTGVGISVQIYDVARNSDYTFDNPALADLQPNEIYRFTFSSQTFYAMVDGVYIGAITPIEAGETIVNRTTAGILASLDTKVNEVPTKVWEDETEYTGEQKGNVLKDARKCARLSLQRTS